MPASGIRAIFDRAGEIERSGHPVLHLEIGRPDWRLPDGVKNNAIAALEAGFNHYISNRGLIELRVAIAEDVSRLTGIGFSPENEIVVTTGASEALSMCALALLGPGDEVIIPQPTWNHYQAVVEMAGAYPVFLPLSGADGFQLYPDKLAGLITPRTKMLILNTPGNPTGTVQPAHYIEEIARLALKHGFFVFSDEVYHEFVYEGSHTSIAQFMGDSELLLYVDSFSKSYAMTGWRIGFIAARKRISDALNRIHQYLTVCGVSFAQRGAARLLRHSQRDLYLSSMRSAFNERRLVWAQALENTEILEGVIPSGAFYLFPRIHYQNMDGTAFCRYMLEEHKVAMVPGEIFGKAYRDFVRISYGRDIQTQKTAVEQIIGAVQ